MSKIIDVVDLSVQLSGQNILSAINFSLPQGEILGIVGPSGCGKTTLLNTIAGFIKQQAGEIVINETITTSATAHIEPEHRNIGMIFQSYALFPHLSVADNITFGVQSLSKNEQQEVLDDLLALLELTGFEERFPHQLSGGQQQRVAIARALAPKPKLLLLDEPFSNIDARLRNELMIELRRLLNKLEMSAIFVTHSKDEVFTFADKMAVISSGKLQQIDSPINICESPKNWQVADFLQLGSWLPLKLLDGKAISALGEIRYEKSIADFSACPMLLLKPKYVRVTDNENATANAVVSHIGLTEHGYHYLVDSLHAQQGLAFIELSLYSSEVFSLGEKLSLVIAEHPPVIFEAGS